MSLKKKRPTSARKSALTLKANRAQKFMAAPAKDVGSGPTNKASGTDAFNTTTDETPAAASIEARPDAYEKWRRTKWNWLLQGQDFMKFLDRKPKVVEQLEELKRWAGLGELNDLRELILIRPRIHTPSGGVQRENPDFVNLIARDSHSWPMLCTLSKSQDAKNYALLKKIGLDSNLPLGVAATKIGRKPAPPRIWAARLVWILEIERRMENNLPLPGSIGAIGIEAPNSDYEGLSQFNFDTTEIGNLLDVFHRSMSHR